MVTTELVEQGDYRWIEVTLDDGEVNLFGLGEIAALSEAFDVAVAEELPAIIVGRRGVFSDGLDLTVFAAGGEPAAQFSANADRVVAQAVSLPIPLIVALTGRTGSFGAMLALAADVALMAKGDGRIGFGDVAEGRALSPMAVELATRLLRSEAVLEATAHGRLFSPAAAASIGFVDEVVPAEELLSAARERAARLGALPKDAYRETKARVRDMPRPN